MVVFLVVLALFTLIFARNRLVRASIPPLRALTVRLREMDRRAGNVARFPRAGAAGALVMLGVSLLGFVAGSVLLGVFGLLGVFLVGGNVWAGGDLDDNVFRAVRNIHNSFVVHGLPGQQRVVALPDGSTGQASPGAATPSNATPVPPAWGLGAFVVVPHDGSPGLLFTTVTPGSAAAAAGVEVGDRLLAANGHPLHAVAQLSAVINATQPSASVQLTLERAGQPLVAQIVRPGPSVAEPVARPAAEPDPLQLGVRMAGLPRSGAIGGELTAVTPGSLAERLGLRAGDVIIALGGTPVASSQEVAAAAAHAGHGDVTIEFLREGRPLSVTVDRSARAAAPQQRTAPDSPPVDEPDPEATVMTSRAKLFAAPPSDDEPDDLNATNPRLRKITVEPHGKPALLAE